jgi:hypothetical protein
MRPINTAIFFPVMDAQAAIVRVAERRFANCIASRKVPIKKRAHPWRTSMLRSGLRSPPRDVRRDGSVTEASAFNARPPPRSHAPEIV